MKPTIRSAALTDYAALARSVGLDPYEILALAGLNRACLTDPDARISADAVRSLMALSARVSGVEDFGLRMAENRNLSNLGPLGLVIKEEPTLGRALEALVRYLRLHNESISLQIETLDHTVVIRQELLSSQTIPLRQSVELSVGVLFRIFKALLGQSWRPQRVCFVHAAPRDLATHRRVFGTAVEFGADFDGIVCRASDLELPIRDTDPLLAQYARRYADSLVSNSGVTAADRVRELVTVLLPAGHCSIERVAQHLGVDRRTVHRRLLLEGKTFTSIVDDLRGDWAIRHVSLRDRALSDVAELLGFSALSAFSHWFRRRFGCTVSEWRSRSASRPHGLEASSQD